MQSDTARFSVAVYVFAALLIDASYEVHILMGGRRVDERELASTLFFFCIWLPLIPIIVGLAERFPFVPGRRLRALEVHFFTALGFSFVTLFAHKLVFCPAGPRYLECVTYYRPEAWLARWFALDYFVYCAVVAGIWAFEIGESIRKRDVQASAMERELASAEIRLLTSQLRPQSLIATFQSIADDVARQPSHAERRITLLADFLRLNVRAVSASDLTVADDVDLLRSWIEMDREGREIDLLIEVEPRVLALPIVSPQLQLLAAERLPQSAQRVVVRVQRQALVIEADGAAIGHVEVEA